MLILGKFLAIAKAVEEWQTGKAAGISGVVNVEDTDIYAVVEEPEDVNYEIILYNYINELYEIIIQSHSLTVLARRKF